MWETFKERIVWSQMRMNSQHSRCTHITCCHVSGTSAQHSAIFCQEEGKTILDNHRLSDQHTARI